MPNPNEANWFTDEGNPEEVTQEQEKETPEGSQPEQKTDEEGKPEDGTPAVEPKKTDDDSIPFHKHPRFKALIEDNRQLRTQLEENAKLMQQLAERPKEEPKLQSAPDWFVKLYGDDPAIWESYQVQRQFELQEIEQSMLSKLEPKLKDIEAEQREKQASVEIDQQLKELEDEGIKFDRNELMKVVYDNQLFDMQGKFNFKAGLAMLAATKKPDNSKVEARKQVAAKTNTNDAGGDAPKKEFMTSDDVAGKDWRSFFNKL